MYDYENIVKKTKTMYLEILKYFKLCFYFSEEYRFPEMSRSPAEHFLAMQQIRHTTRRPINPHGHRFVPPFASPDYAPSFTQMLPFYFRHPSNFRYPSYFGKFESIMHIAV
jgi:hypothetical protein